MGLQRRRRWWTVSGCSGWLAELEGNEVSEILRGWGTATDLLRRSAGLRVAGVSEIWAEAAMSKSRRGAVSEGDVGGGERERIGGRRVARRRSLLGMSGKTARVEGGGGEDQRRYWKGSRGRRGVAVGKRRAEANAEEGVDGGDQDLATMEGAVVMGELGRWQLEFKGELIFFFFLENNWRTFRSREI